MYLRDSSSLVGAYTESMSMGGGPGRRNKADVNKPRGSVMSCDAMGASRGENIKAVPLLVVRLTLWKVFDDS